jgi:hypothetical protein
VRYQRTTPDDADLRARVTALAHERRRFGHRRRWEIPAYPWRAATTGGHHNPFKNNDKYHARQTLTCREK